MEINEQTTIFSLTMGCFFGVLLILLNLLRNIKSNKKIFLFILDFTFTVVLFVVTYIGAIPLTYGRVRLIQVVLELLAMLTVYYVFEPIIVYLSNKHTVKQNKQNFRPKQRINN